MKTKYQQYENHLREIADLEAIQAILGWDKEVNMPAAGVSTRTRQLALLAVKTHELATSDELGKLLSDLYDNKDSLSFEAAKNIELTQKDFQRQQKYTKAFVEKRSLIASATYHAWVEARKENDATDYLTKLDQMIELKKEEAELLGFEGHPYNALLDLYEPEMTVAELDLLFTAVKEHLVDFVGKIRQHSPIDNSFFKQHFSKDQQWQFGLELLKGIGYDFNAGRQDISPHPFTTSFGPGDIRVTTRIDEQNFENMCWSCIHEGGHALYEQGLPEEKFGLPAGKYVSLGIHESQSRLWENNVGRSQHFWAFWYPRLQRQFSQQLSNTSLSDFYKGINKIYPHPIRTESDELHYHFHILIRYEIEKNLLDGTLKAKDLKEVWAAKYKAYLDLEITDDNTGILQDIHWSYGSIGYFPTYSLGSFYAAQFYHQATQDIEALDLQLQSGNCAPLLTWLKKNIHQKGQLYSAKELCKQITGESLNFKYFQDYVEKKYREIYA